MIEFKAGEQCVKNSSELGCKCSEVVDTSVDKGNRFRLVRGQRALVVARLRNPEGVTVYEDTFWVGYPGKSCVNPVAAVSTLARAISANALSRRPVSTQFYAAYNTLHCSGG